MKWINNLKSIVLQTTNVVNRFFMVALASSLGTMITIVFFDEFANNSHQGTILLRIIMCCILAVPLFLSVHLWSERKRLKLIPIILLFTLSVGVLLIYFLSIGGLTNLPLHEGQIGFRFLLLFLGFHGVLSFVLFNIKREVLPFWQFNKHFLLNFLLSGFYSGILFLGLSGAILAINQLLGVDLEDTIYPKLFIFIVGIFNTWFFLSRIPKNLEAFTQDEDYPTGLKVFVQYVLLPLVSIYLVILYLYIGKIGIEWSLPNGWVGNLILGFAIVGILAFLLLYPVRHFASNKWIGRFNKIFYYLLIPLIILLWFSLGVRVSEYGITMERYLVGLLALWLTGITIYFIVSKKDNIIFIPLTLSLMFLLASFGPWGINKLSAKSQFRQMSLLLDSVGLRKDGKIVVDSSAIKITNAQAKRLFSIVEYLDNNHNRTLFKNFGFEPWNAYIDSLIKTDSAMARVYSYQFTNRLLSSINITQSVLYKTDEKGYRAVDFKSSSKEYDIHGQNILYRYDFDITDHKSFGKIDQQFNLELAKGDLQFIATQSFALEFLPQFTKLIEGMELNPEIGNRIEGEIKKEISVNKKVFTFYLLSGVFERNNNVWELMRGEIIILESSENEAMGRKANYD